jgi:hypothetical protein
MPKTTEQLWAEAHYELGKLEALQGRKFWWLKRIKFVITYIEERETNEDSKADN